MSSGNDFEFCCVFVQHKEFLSMELKLTFGVLPKYSKNWDVKHDVIKNLFTIKERYLIFPLFTLCLPFCKW